MKLIVSTFLVLLLLVSFDSFAGSYRHPYYSNEVNQKIWSFNVKNEDLIRLLKKVFQSVHVIREGKADLLTDYCPDGAECYTKIQLGYKTAKKHLFGGIHLREGNNGYFVQDVYCNNILDNDTPNIYRIGPMVYPNHTVANCEHTWPKSRFSKYHSYSEQECDLHHLYPTDSLANNVRGNHEFGEVPINTHYQLCAASKFSNYTFEPPNEQKGNVARALFYFSVKYDLEISASEEYYLRKWHAEDPVDEDEMYRNDYIHDVQGNRNPFIDYPFLEGLISDF